MNAASFKLSLKADSGYEAESKGRCTPEQYARAVAALHLPGEHDGSFLLLAAKDAPVLTKAAKDVLFERARQIQQEGWDHHHDDAKEHPGGLAVAGACYALDAAGKSLDDDHWSKEYADTGRRLWPWDAEWWKPKDPRRNLVRAAALILAEIDKLDRAEVSK
jgi:hypothetical protein